MTKNGGIGDSAAMIIESSSDNDEKMMLTWGTCQLFENCVQSNDDLTKSQAPSQPSSRRRRRRRRRQVDHKRTTTTTNKDHPIIKITIPSGPLLIKSSRQQKQHEENGKKKSERRLFLCRHPRTFTTTRCCFSPAAATESETRQEATCGDGGTGAAAAAVAGSTSSSVADAASTALLLRYHTAIEVVTTAASRKAATTHDNPQQQQEEVEEPSLSCTTMDHHEYWQPYLYKVHPIVQDKNMNLRNNDTEISSVLSVIMLKPNNNNTLQQQQSPSTTPPPSAAEAYCPQEDFVGIFASPPTPLLSVAFQCYADPHFLPPASSSDTSTTTSQQRRRLASLLQSCLKRQLVACPLIWKEESNHDRSNTSHDGIGLTTIITLDLLERRWTFQVESITTATAAAAASRRSRRNSSSMGYSSPSPTSTARRTTTAGHDDIILFTILPSTRITLHMASTPPPPPPPKITSRRPSSTFPLQQSPQKEEEEERHVSSAASRLLADTLLCCCSSSLCCYSSLLSTSSSSSSNESTTRIITRQSLLLSLHAAEIPRSFLLSGPPGVGKSFAVKMAISSFQEKQQHSTCHFISLRGSDILAETTTTVGNNAGGAGGAALALKRHFDRAIRLLQNDAQSTSNNDAAKSVALIFLDECDALLASTGASDSSTVVTTTSGGMTAAMLAFLLDCMYQRNHIHHRTNNNDMATAQEESSCWKRIVVVAATNRIDSIPASLRRPGRFDREIPMGPPNVTERASILSSLLYGESSSTTTVVDDDDTTQQNNLDDESKKSSSMGNMISPPELFEVAADCVGYVAADLAALVRRATILALTANSGRELAHNSDANNNGIVVTVDCLRRAMSDMVASALRDASLHAPPTTTWNDIAGTAGGAKTTLRQAMEWPRQRRDAFRALGLKPPRGILLFGPPGGGKTTLARAAAGTAGVAFLSLSPADVYASSYVGEAEAVVRRAFLLARSAAPCVLFFDEIDAILGSDDASISGGGMSRNTGSSAEARVLSTFLNEMDGIDIGSGGTGSSNSSSDIGNGGVLVLGATNRPWTLDAALLRPGRFDKKILVPPPDWEGRRLIFEMQTKRWTATATAMTMANKTRTNSGLEQEDETDQSARTGEDDSSLNLDVLADESAGMTGAEIVGACQSATHKALCEVIASSSQKRRDISSSNSNIIDASFQQRQQELLLEALRDVQPLLVVNPSILHDFETFAKKGG